MDAGCAQPEHQRRRHDGFDEPARAELFDCRIEPEQHAKSKSKTQLAKPNTIMNRRITFTVFAGRGLRTTDHVWIDPEQLENIPHPAYVRKALQLAKIS